MDTALAIAGVACLVALIASAFVTQSVMANIDKIGSEADIKIRAISRSLFNFYAIVALTFILFARALDAIDMQLFVALFVLVLGGLGFKITSELLQKKR